MSHFQAIAFSFISFFLLFGCNSNPSNNTLGGDDNKAVQVSIDSFLTQFPKITLPLALPATQAAASGKTLDNEVIEKIFATSGYKPVFGHEKDVPDLEDNASSAKYHAVGLFQTDAYTAVIIRKTEEDTYYYLSTFDPDGEFIQGICIAFTIGNGTETERIASINDDFSIQIRQTDKLAETPSEQSQNIFYEITGDGHIQKLNNDTVKVPA